MESKLKYYQGRGASASPNGTSFFTTDNYVENVEVSNGNVQGDHKTPNNFSFSVTKVMQGHYDQRQNGFYQGKPDYLYVASDQVIGPSHTAPFCTPDFARTTDEAMRKVYDTIRGNSNGAVDFAEGGQTIRMIRNTLNVRKMMRDVVQAAVKKPKYRSLSKGQERLDYVSSKWLEYRYGWLPLVHSTFDALDNLSRKIHGGLFVVSGRSGSTVRFRDVSGVGSYFDPLVVREAQMKFRTEVKLQFRLPAGQQIYDWTALNPVGIAWELMPLSFVADWFVNVSDVLSLWEDYLVFANRFVGGYLTNSYREDYTFTSKGSTHKPVEVYPPNPETGEGGGAPTNQVYSSVENWTCKHVRLHKSRTRLTSLPMPAEGVRIRPELNAKRLADAAALLYSFSRRAH